MGKTKSTVLFIEKYCTENNTDETKLKMSKIDDFMVHHRSAGSAFILYFELKAPCIKCNHHTNNEKLGNL